MPALPLMMIEKLRGLSPEDLQKVLRFVDTLASVRPEPPTASGPNGRDLRIAREDDSAPDANDPDEEKRPWRGVFEVEPRWRDEIPLPLSSGEPLPPREQPFDILWDPNRHDD